jgi:hypothetical protein
MFSEYDAPSSTTTDESSSGTSPVEKFAPLVPGAVPSGILCLVSGGLAVGVGVPLVAVRVEQRPASALDVGLPMVLILAGFASWVIGIYVAKRAIAPSGKSEKGSEH